MRQAVFVAVCCIQDRNSADPSLHVEQAAPLLGAVARSRQSRGFDQRSEGSCDVLQRKSALTIPGGVYAFCASYCAAARIGDHTHLINLQLVSYRILLFVTKRTIYEAAKQLRDVSQHEQLSASCASAAWPKTCLVAPMRREALCMQEYNRTIYECDRLVETMHVVYYQILKLAVLIGSFEPRKESARSLGS